LVLEPVIGPSGELEIFATSRHLAAREGIKEPSDHAFRRRCRSRKPYRLTLLAPAITDCIPDGRHYAGRVALERLMRPFSASCGEQLQSF
jgi:hypothetical protein